MTRRPDRPVPEGRSESAPPLFPPAKESDAPFAAAPVEFIGSFPNATVRLDPTRPEVVVLGRSNVGKSSLLNALFGRRLARVSTTPGRTGHLNVYRLPTLYLLDLPGYGFARLSHGERTRHAALVEGVITRRRSLRGVLWLLDIRHPPSDEDRRYAELLGASGVPVLAALTKSDKLPFGQRAARQHAIAAELALPAEQVQLTSSRSGEGIADLGASILAAVAATEES
mgnify:CR=1 FL=1